MWWRQRSSFEQQTNVQTNTHRWELSNETQSNIKQNNIKTHKNKKDKRKKNHENTKQQHYEMKLKTQEEEKNDRYWSVAKELEHIQFNVGTKPGNTELTKYSSSSSFFLHLYYYLKCYILITKNFY